MPRLGDRAEAGDAGHSQGIGKTGLDRGVRSDDHQIGHDLLGQGDKGCDIGRFDSPDIAKGRHARIAWCHHQTGQKRRGRDLPGECVFAAAGTDKKDVHGPALKRLWGRRSTGQS